MALIDNLISYWALDEPSGNALDSHGSNHLTETSGTIGSAAGKVGNCRDFEAADTEWFTIADNADLSTGDIDFSIAGWVQLESLVTGVILSHWTSTGAQRCYQLLYNSSTSRFELQVSADGSSATAHTATANNLGAPSTATWYFIAAGHSASANEIWISGNAGTVNTTAHSTGVFDSATVAHGMGASSLGTNHWDGLLDEIGFWKRDIRSDLTELYNAGAGRNYAYISGGGGGGVVDNTRNILNCINGGLL